MKNHGTVWVQDVEDDTQFPHVVEQAREVAARTMKCGVGVVNDDVRFLACSPHGDVYMVHFSSPYGETCAARLTQMFVGRGDHAVPLGIR